MKNSKNRADYQREYYLKNKERKQKEKLEYMRTYYKTNKSEINKKRKEKRNATCDTASISFDLHNPPLSPKEEWAKTITFDFNF